MNLPDGSKAYSYSGDGVFSHEILYGDLSKLLDFCESNSKQWEVAMFECDENAVRAYDRMGGFEVFEYIPVAEGYYSLNKAKERFTRFL